MPWLRIDDGFAEHPKMQAISERARWMHVVALCYCSRNLTDGLLDPRAVKVVAAIVDKPCKQAVGSLVAAGLWLEEESGGYRIKDFLEWNPDSATVKRLRKERQDSGRRGGLAKAKADAMANATAFACTPPQPLPPHKDQAPLGAVDQKEGLRLLVLATGVRSRGDIDKLTRTVIGNKCSSGAIKLAIEAATHPSARDPLAVALATLKKRRAA